MVFVIKPGVSEQKIRQFVDKIEAQGYKTFLSVGTEHTVVCLIGNTASIDMDTVVETNAIVEYGKRVTEPYKAVNRTVHPEDTVVNAGGIPIGNGMFQVISGPCSVESEEQIVMVAKSVKESGATLLRGGAFKPRTSPYAFLGLHEEGLRLLLLAKKETGLPVVTEVMNQTQLPMFEDIDVIQIGARNMQNFDLLREVGRLKKPVLLKRGLANTIEELLMSAEYIMSEGNTRVILCERGIRTFEIATRNTLDLSAIPILKQKSHLPVIVDPSHAAGIRGLVAPLAKAAVAVGADGLMIETHNDPANALCDGAQSLDLEQFDELMRDIKCRVGFEGKIMGINNK
jgi:3-deoxy-7-phosphoheptulonate synthase